MFTARYDSSFRYNSALCHQKDERALPGNRTVNFLFPLIITNLLPLRSAPYLPLSLSYSELLCTASNGNLNRCATTGRGLK